MDEQVTELAVNRLLGPHPVIQAPSNGLRRGYTTGACAAAAARAATRALLTGCQVSEIRIDLPVERDVLFRVKRCELGAGYASCSVIKDAGDDPDVTHGAEIVATVEWQDQPGIAFAAGPGVGMVTKPGLPVEVGQPAINPGPRRMSSQAVLAELGQASRGLKVTISVPDGQRLAEQTMTPRLGIVGGISILGTTGIVLPYSQAAYRATIYVALKVAASNGIAQAVLATGVRSQDYARRRYPHWPDLSFVEVGDHMGYALTRARRLRFRRVVIAGMIGKVSKLAQGRWQTHVSQGEVDLNFLAEQAEQLGADAGLVARCQAANTAHHVQLLLRKAGLTSLEARLAQLAAHKAFELGQCMFDVEVLVYHINGELLGSAISENRSL